MNVSPNDLHGTSGDARQRHDRVLVSNNLQPVTWRYLLLIMGLSVVVILILLISRQANAETIYLPNVLDNTAQGASDTSDDNQSGDGNQTGEEDQAGGDPQPCTMQASDTNAEQSKGREKKDNCDRLYDELLAGRTLDGSGNNEQHAQQGTAGTAYTRVADAAYVNGLSAMASTPSPRYVSNRIYNDNAENLFSRHDVTHWGFVWGQFLDHSIGLAQGGDEEIAIPFDATDPLEQFENDLGMIGFTRSAAAPGTGETGPRAQVNLVSSYVDAFAVYGGTAERLDWLRAGPLDGDPSNNLARLLSDNGYLPTLDQRGDATTAPTMFLFGPQYLDASSAVVAGDMRANENLGLTAVQTLFLREHNRIVDLLPAEMPEEVKFAIARRIVGATQQYITYREFLPAMGIKLAPYEGYDATVDASLTTEFATVGYRAHSMIHGEFEMEGHLDDYSVDVLEALEAAGVEVDIEGDDVEFAIPLNIAFGRPQLLQQIGLDAVLVGLASEAQYANDEMIDNQLRSVLFQIPSPDAENPAACLDGVDLPDCFSLVNDLGVLDMVRAYDHGIPSYNELRAAYGLPPVTSFTQITGEPTEEFPIDPLIDADDPLNDPNILDVIAFYDAQGQELTREDIDAGALPVRMVRRTTLAARLKALYGSVDALDPFTGMLAEKHVRGTEFGELQLAIWQAQFTALRDGDRFFYLNDPALKKIHEQYGIDYRQTLAQVIVNNTAKTPEEVPTNVFKTE